MSRRCLLMLTVAALAAPASAPAATVTENFSADPLARGWQVSGDTNLFRWNSTNKNLEATWDSRQTNTYFFWRLEEVLTRFDDFQIDFDLLLQDAASGIEPGKTGPLQVAAGFLNYSDATADGFSRGAGMAPNIAEVCYYPTGYYDFGGFTFPAAPAAVPSFVSGGPAMRFAPGFVAPYNVEFPTQTVVHVSLVYRGGNQAATLSATTNGAPLGQFPPLSLTDPAQSYFSRCDSYFVDTFSVTSYGSHGDDYDSLLAHGVIDNLVFSTRLCPAPELGGQHTPEGYWDVQFFSRVNWRYSLERSANFAAWSEVAGPVPGLNGCLALQDTSPPPGQAFYRVKAVRP